MAAKAQVRPAKGKTALEALITGVAAIAALVICNFVACKSSTKWDYTENSIYTLSSASKDMVKTLKEKVTVKAYFGNVPAEHEEKMLYIEQLLAEYRDASGGKIAFEKIDPWGNKQLMEDLKKDGIDVLRLRSIKSDKVEQVPMYFHIVFSHLDKKEVWTPSGQFSIEGLEYDFSSRIKRLGFGKKKVGITTGFGEPQAQVLALDGKELLPGVRFGLGDLYEVAPVDWSKDPASLDGVDILIVNGPKANVSDAAKYALDQYVMSGKPVFFLQSGIKWEQSGQQPGMPPEMQQPDQPYVGMPLQNGLNDLLESYGFKIHPDTVIDTRNTARGLIPPGKGDSLARGFFPLAKSLQSGNKQMLQGIDVVVMPWTSTVELVGPLAGGKQEGSEVLPLLSVLPTALSREGMIAITREFKLAASAADKKGAQIVAVAVAGKYPSFYAGKPVPEGVTPPEAPRTESPTHTRMVVVASTAFAADTTLSDMRFHGDLSYANGFTAIHNMVDWLAEDTALLAARTKSVERPLEAVTDTKKTIIKFANIGGPPVALILFGVVYWQIRERRRRRVSI
jgi:gliding-associated putative ABC transporter substrate-binding component GldG